MSIMKGTFIVVFLLQYICPNNCCEFVDAALFCTTIPTDFPLGVSTLLMSVRNAGEINATVFHHDNLASVTSVIIRGAGITRIAEGAFSSFLSITSLALDQNKLTDINHKWLARPVVLTELSMSENHIHVLTGPMLREFTHLNKLNLSKNKIKTIQPGAFSNLTALAHLDLSDNSLTQLTSQMFSQLHKTNMSLQGNQWMCSCDAEDSIEFIRDLKSRSLLLHAEDVTCVSPPALRGQPVWNISVCNAPTLPSYPTSETKTPGSSQSTTNAAVTTFYGLNVSRPTGDIKVTQETIHTEDTPTTKTHQAPPASNLVPMLITIIVVLCVVLLLVIVLAVLYRKKRNRKVMATNYQSQVATLAQRHQKTNMRWDIEAPCQMPFTGVRAQSANAIFYTSPFGELCADLAPSKDKEAGVEDTDGNRVEGGQNDAVNVQNATSPVDCENVPYLSIGTCPNTTNYYMGVKGREGPGAMVGRGLNRISTWPPTAVQWQERCKRQKQQESENVQLAWTQIKEFKVPCELDSAGHLPNNFEQNDSKVWERIAEIQGCFKGDEAQKGWEVNMTDYAGSSSFESDKNDLPFSDSFVNLEEATGKDSNSKNTTPQKMNVDTDGASTSGMGSSKRRKDAKRNASNEPSCGGKEYVFMDLLHEVVQNRGRWTRERWRQIHMSK